MSKFIRILRKIEGKADLIETLYNVDHITKIEVKYGIRSSDPEDRMIYGVLLREGMTNSLAIRSYKIYFRSETVLMIRDGDDPVIRAIQEIYDNAIRSPEPHELPPQDDDA